MDKSMLIRLIISVIVVLCCGFYFYISHKREMAEYAKKEAFYKEQRDSKKNEDLYYKCEQTELHEMGLDNTTIEYLITKAKAEDKTPAEIIGELVRERQSVAA
jgi:uncharacterized protein YxeA